MKFISAIVAAIAVGCLSTAALSQSTAVQWTTESGGNGHWYQGLIVSQEGASWTTARTFAIARGGDLAVVPSATFAQWLFTNTVDNTTLWAQSVGPWVGGYQLTGSIEPSGGWLWANGSEILPEMWSSGQPDNYTPCGGDNNRMGYWNAGEGVPKPYLQDSPDLAVIPCIGPVISAIVEWSADCNSDGIVDYGQILSGALADANANNIPDCCEQGIPCFDLDADGVLNNLDNCPTNANPLQEDLDNDGVGDACDACPDVAGLPTCNGCPLNVCGECGIALDTDSDGTANCIDDDDDNDGVVDSADAFPLEASESVDTDGDGIGNNADQDDDGDGADDATDGCPLDANKSAPGQCGCGIADTDSDGDGVADCIDNCVAVSNPTQDDCNGDGIGEACESFIDCNSNGITDSCDIASGFAQDCNANGKPDSCDLSASDSPYPGAVQWTVASGGNGHWYWRNPAVVEWNTASSAANALGADLASITSQFENNFIQNILPPGSAAYIGGIRESAGWRWVTGEQWSFTSWNPGEPNGGYGQILWIESTGGWNDHVTWNNISPSIYEWPAGLPTESDCNANGVPDSCDIASGAAGDCNTNSIPDSCEVDSDADGTIDACDGCPNDPVKIATGACGCGVADTDTDSDGTANCIDDDDDNDGVVDSSDAFPLDASESDDTDGDGIGNNADQDDDGDGADDATDGCPLDANKSAPGQCGCGIADTDSDGDGVADCIDNCVAVSNPTQDDCNGDGIGEACESFIDCNSNGNTDSCDIASGFAQDCNANGIPDSCDISAGNGSPYPGAVQWTVASGGNGHWYFLVISGPITWADARSACEIHGGHLVTPTTPEEEAFAIQIGNRAEHPAAWVNDFGGNAGGPWLGGYQPINADNQQPWAWVTGETWSWAGWAPGEPNGGFGPGNFVTVQLGYANSNYYRGWADIGLTDFPSYPLSPSYIIEWESSLPAESDCNSNGIPDSCDIASGAAGDCNTNAIPDSCELDSDADGTIDACDGCPNDPAKIAAGICGCGVADTDTDSDGTANCIDDDDDNDGVVDSSDAFPLDASESVDTDGDGVGNNADQDDDGDGADDATDGCPLDPTKAAPGQCGCGNPDTDSDGDGIANCVDNCVAVANPTQADCNGNGIGEACESFTDCNANSIPDSCDLASGFAQDCNANGKPDSCDIAAGNGSPYPGAVQWTVASGGNGHWYLGRKISTNTAVSWTDARTAANAVGADLAITPNEATHLWVFANVASNEALWSPSFGPWVGGYQSQFAQEPGGGWMWIDGSTNGVNGYWLPGQPDNATACGGPENYLHYMRYSGLPANTFNDMGHSGTCGLYGNGDWVHSAIFEWSTGLPTESDCNSNGIPDSCDIASGAAGDCNANSIPDSCEVDSDADGTIDACDGCPNDPAKIAAGVCGCGVADTDTDSDGTANCIDDDDDNDGAVDSADAFPLDASESVDTDGDGIGNNADQDDDGDGADDATDGCPLDANKSAPGQCGCGIADTDSDGDGIANCIDNCVAIANPNQNDCNGNGIGEACESFTDCNANSIPDSCDIASGFAQDCNGNGKPDSCDIAAGNGSPYPGAVQWTVASGGNGHWYKGVIVSLKGASWTTARGFAMERGADLAVVPSLAFADWLFNNTVNSAALWNADLGPWVGGYQQSGAPEPLGGWVWVDGAAILPALWVGGQPDDATYCGGNNNRMIYWNAGQGIPRPYLADVPDLAVQTCSGLVISAVIEWSTGLPTESDCNSNGIPDSCEIASGSAGDCDNDGILNSCEIASGALDCNSNGIPDTCDVLSGGAAIDCNANGIPDSCDIASGASMDCNSNAIPDSCDIATGASRDVDSNGVPDECKPDCNNNDLPDAWEIAQGLVPDCNNNGIPDSCENDSRAANTGNMGRFGNGVPATGTLSAVVATTTAVTVRIEAVGDLGAATEYATLKLGQTVVGTLLFQTTGRDCPANPDVATLTLTKAQWNAIVASAGSSGNVAVTLTASPLVDAAQCGEAGMSHVSVTYGGPAYDCDGNGLSDLCEVGSGTGDCNNNSILDACELLSGSAPDIDANGVIDSCQTDCNGNSLPDTYEVAQGLVSDCNGNGIPDSCDLAGGAPDCNANGIIDSCDIASGSAPDCNGNGKPDSCDISSGFAPDCNANSIPDSCDISSGTVPDCNNNGVPDSCDVASGTPDCNHNGVPDSCDIASGVSHDVDTNGVPDECKTDCNANGLPDAWEILQQLVPDCNGNSVPDSCDVADGTAKDCNENSIPDSCDIAAGEVDKNSDGQPDDCQYRYGDFDLDGNIGGSDLAVLLALWGTIDPVVGDITGDGRVDGQDLAQALARWGPVP